MTHKAVLLALAAVGLVAACVTTKGPLGAECLKNEDCLSGLCSQLVCTEGAPLVGTMANNADAATAPETGGSGEAGAPEAAAEAGAEAGGDAASDGPAD
jgi:hypothetical protein